MFNTCFLCENYGAKYDKIDFFNWQKVFEFSLSDEFIQKQKQERKIYCLSHFTFDDGFSIYFHHNKKSIAGYNGECFARQIIIDIDDNKDIEIAKKSSIILLNHLENTLKIQGIILFFTGSKGFNLNIPIENIDAKPSLTFNQSAKQFVLSEASKVGIEVDNKIYDKVRKIRLPNSLNGKSGLFKIPITKQELTSLSIDEIQQLAKEPRQFNIESHYSKLSHGIEATKAWNEQQTVLPEKKKMVLSASATEYDNEIINRHTRNFIANGAKEGQRNNQLFQAACNLFKNGFDEEQIEKLLYDPAIQCGIEYAEYRTTINQASKRCKL